MSKPQSQHHSKGDMLSIFQKPYTQEDREGFARLEKFLRPDTFSDVEGFEWWKVRFAIDDNSMPMQFEETTYERIVQP